MLFIHATNKLAKSAGLRFEPSHNPEQGLWIDNWYANSIAIGNRTEVIIFTNPECLYSFLIPTNGRPFFAIVEKLRRRIAATLVNIGISEKAVSDIAKQHAQYIVCKTDSR